MLTKLTGCSTSTFLYISLIKHVKSAMGPGFGPQGHNLNKFGRGSQDDTTYIISRLLRPSGFYVLPIYAYVKHMSP